MTCRISTDWSYRGFDALIMENDKLRATILPGYGAKVFEFVLKEAGRDMLYHNPRVEIRQPVFGANVDNWWHGGIDECIPTGTPCRYKGEDYSYLGELWSLPWDYSIEKLERGSRPYAEAGNHISYPCGALGHSKGWGWHPRESAPGNQRRDREG